MRFYALDEEDAWNQAVELRDRTWETGINPMHKGHKMIYMGIVHRSTIEAMKPGQ
jgi:hypothetical protein